MNRIIETCNTSTAKCPTKAFDESEFIVGYALIIGASCFYQPGSVLFNNNKDQSDSWDTVIQNARFDRYMKLYHFKEFRYYLSKIFERPLEKDSDL